MCWNELKNCLIVVCLMFMHVLCTSPHPFSLWSTIDGVQRRDVLFVYLGHFSKKGSSNILTWDSTTPRIGKFYSLFFSSTIWFIPNSHCIFIYILPKAWQIIFLISMPTSIPYTVQKEELFSSFFFYSVETIFFSFRLKIITTFLSERGLYIIFKSIDGD